MKPPFVLALAVLLIALAIAAMKANGAVKHPLLVDANPASEVLTCETHENPCDKIDCDKIDTKELT